ncbi:MAG: DUF6572 domain-containing protein [Patescibacteria group bacterium]
MSINEANKIDFLAFTNDGQGVHLVITDHHDWTTDEQAHLFLLQEKINAYLAFIESGEIYKNSPECEDKVITIKISFKHPPTDHACDFLKKAEQVINKININLDYRVGE